MSLANDIERVEQLVAAGSAEQRAWLGEWHTHFAEAAGAEDEQRCEDLADILIFYERTELRPPKRVYSLEEVIDLLGFDRAEFELPAR